jgi:hypothetical protein
MRSGVDLGDTTDPAHVQAAVVVLPAWDLEEGSVGGAAAFAAVVEVAGGR